MLDLMEGKTAPDKAASASFLNRLMFASFLLFMFYVVVFNSYEEFRDNIQEEVHISTMQLGKDGPAVAQNAISMFDSIIEFPLIRWIKKEVDSRTRQKESYVEEEVGKWKQVKYLSSMFEDIGIKFILMIYQACFRLAMLGYWALVILPFGCALLYEGITERRIKMFEFKSNSVKKQKIWSMGFALGFILMNVYLIVPYAQWLGMYFPVISLLFLMIVFKNIVSHVTKTF